MKIFEHKIIYLDGETEEIRNSCFSGAEVAPISLYESVLDKFGDQGWELASVLACPRPGYPEQLVATAWFKRPVTTGADAPAPPA